MKAGSGLRAEVQTPSTEAQGFRAPGLVVMIRTKVLKKGSCREAPDKALGLIGFRLFRVEGLGFRVGTEG